MKKSIGFAILLSALLIAPRPVEAASGAPVWVVEKMDNVEEIEYKGDVKAQAFSYDRNGMIVSVTDTLIKEKNAKRNFSYDADGKLLSLEEGDFVTSYTYGKAGRVRKAVEEGDTALSGKRTTVGTFKWENGVLASLTEKAGFSDGTKYAPTVTSFQFNTDGQLIFRKYRNKQWKTKLDTSYSYDEKGYLLKSESSTWDYTYKNTYKEGRLSVRVSQSSDKTEGICSKHSIESCCRRRSETYLTVE